MITGYQCSQCFEMLWSEQEAFAHLRKNHPDKFAAFYNMQVDVEKPEEKMRKALSKIHKILLSVENVLGETERKARVDQAIQIIERTIEK